MSKPRTTKHLIPDLELAYAFTELDNNTGGVAAKDNGPGEDEHACTLHEGFSIENCQLSRRLEDGVEQSCETVAYTGLMAVTKDLTRI